MYEVFHHNSNFTQLLRLLQRIVVRTLHSVVSDIYLSMEWNVNPKE